MTPTERQSFTVFVVACGGFVGGAGLSWQTGDFSWGAVAANALAGAFLTGLGWAGTVVYADVKISESDEYNAVLDRADKAEAAHVNALELLIDAKAAAEAAYDDASESPTAQAALTQLLDGPLSSAAYRQAAQGEYVPVEPEQPAVAP